MLDLKAHPGKATAIGFVRHHCALASHGRTAERANDQRSDAPDMPNANVDLAIG
jgi:hypothetical protein